ncbi:MAG: glycine betaine ABC transporter substrate-binding protein, partial [Prolixibacteraceae bacterium]
MKKRVKRYLKKIRIARVLVAVLMLTVACQSSDSADETRTLRIVYTDWSESIAITYLTSVLLEEKMEYTTILKLTDVESAYNEVAKKEADVFLD